MIENKEGTKNDNMTKCLEGYPKGVELMQI